MNGIWEEGREVDEERVMVPSTLVWALGLEGPPHGDSWPAGGGAAPGEESTRSGSHSQ